jgi:hypothetical protein
MKITHLGISLIILFSILSCISAKNQKTDLYVDQTLHQGISSASAPASNPYRSQAGYDQDPSGN